MASRSSNSRNHEIDETIGQRIKVYRDTADLSQKELANKVGVRTGAISDWETGKRDLGWIVRANNLCIALKADLDTILETEQELSLPDNDVIPPEEVLRTWYRASKAQKKQVIPKDLETRKRIGRNIATLRKREKLSQLELAKAVGVVETAVSYWETAQRSMDWLFKSRNLCEALGCKLSDLAAEKEPSYEELIALFKAGKIPRMSELKP